MSETLRRVEIPVAITIICALLQVIPYYLDIPVLAQVSVNFRDWMLLVASYATFIGIITVSRIHINKVQKLSSGYPYSIIILISAIVMAFAGLPLPEIGLGMSNIVYKFLYQNVISILKASITAMNAFFVTSAAWRGFRARNIEGAIVLTSGLLIICANAPIMTSLWPPFSVIGDWIFSIPNLATQRAVLIGSALGAIALAARLLMGIERGYLGGGTGEED